MHVRRRAIAKKAKSRMTEKSHLGIPNRNFEAAFSLSTCWRVASHSPPSRSRPSRGFCTRRAAKMDLVEFTHAVRCSFDPLSEPHLRGMAAASLDQLKRSDQV